MQDQLAIIHVQGHGMTRQRQAPFNGVLAVIEPSWLA